MHNYGHSVLANESNGQFRVTGVFPQLSVTVSTVQVMAMALFIIIQDLQQFICGWKVHRNS